MDTKELQVLETSISRASSDVLNSLHQTVARYLLKQLKNVIENPQDEIDPKIIDQVLKFLKDNDIKADAKYSRPLHLLSEPEELKALPFEVPEEDEDEQDI